MPGCHGLPIITTLGPGCLDRAEIGLVHRANFNTHGMSKHWREELDPATHRDFMKGFQDAGGLPRSPVRDSMIPAWAYFVTVAGFTFEFASVAQIEECLEYCREKVHPSTRERVQYDHFWNPWFSRLPKGLLRGNKRERVVAALERALAEFGTD